MRIKTKDMKYIVNFTTKEDKRLSKRVYAETEEDAIKWIRFNHQIKTIDSIKTK